MRGQRSVFLMGLSVLFFLLLSSLALAGSRYMQLVASGEGWALGKEGLFWTKDNGSHWKNISPPGVRYFNDVFFLDPDHGWALFASDGENEGSLDFHVATTTDGGSTWAISLAKTRTQVPSQFDGTAWLDFVDKQHGWLLLRQATSVGFSIGWLLATNDGGKSWKQLADPPLASRPSFSTPSDGWLAGGAGRDELWVTRDAGNTWQGEEIATPKSAGDANRPAYGRPEFRDAVHGYLPVTFSQEIDAKGPRTSAIALFVTDNGGRSWVLDRSTPSTTDMYGVSPLLSAFVDAEFIFAPNSDQKHLTLLSVDINGKTAGPSTEVSPDDSEVREMSFADRSHGWILTNNYRLLSTTDGGATWKWLVPGLVPRDIPPPPPPAHGTPLKRLGEGPTLPPPGRPPQLLDEPYSVPPPISPQLYVAPHLGFEQHQVTTQGNMQKWFNWSPFFDVGFYLGGANYCYQKSASGTTCAVRLDPNLIANWVTGVSGQGWGFMPLWVGPQAPCNTGKFVLINTNTSAAVQGAAEADKASAAMNSLGLAGTVVFYDMENYPAKAGSSCSQVVQQFLGGWVSEMNADGFPTAAVYGNPLPAQLDFSTVPGLTQVWITTTPTKEQGTMPGGPPRVTIWGLGSGSNALQDTLWSNDQRAHQFLIDITGISYGGTPAFQIDYDIVDLQLPGGNAHKAYDLSASTTITYLGSLNNAAGGINEVWPDSVGTPLFITGSQVGQIVGSWNSAAMNNGYMGGEGTGFIDNSGAITLLTNSQWPDQNYNMGINNVGYAVGSNSYAGFVSYVAANTYTTVIGPTGSEGSYLNAINDDNQAVGSYLVNFGTQDSYSLGMLYQSGSAYLVNPGCPGESDTGTGGETAINGINGFGQMVGSYTSPDGTQMHGFLYSNGTCTTFDLGPDQGFTYPYGINNNGQIVGTYSTGSTLAGFILDGSVVYSFSYSGAGTTVITAPNSINDAGQLVGGAFLGDGCPPVSCYAAFMYSLVPAQ